METIMGKSVYVSLEGGFWGISTDAGNYLPIEMPEQLKCKDQPISCTVELIEVMSLQNWGQPCRIISFKTLT